MVEISKVDLVTGGINQLTTAGPTLEGFIVNYFGG
jgi:hypothetical protein